MVSPNSGSNGGTLIQATVPGVGTLTKDVDLVDETGRTVCRKDAEVVKYGLVQCWSRRSLMETEFAVKLKIGDKTHECANDDKAKCNYKQDNTGKVWPKILSLSKTDTTLVITGQAFFTVGYDVTAFFKGIKATSVKVDSETQITATFEGGVPITSKKDQNRETERANVMFQL